MALTGGASMFLATLGLLWLGGGTARTPMKLKRNEKIGLQKRPQKVFEAGRPPECQFLLIDF